MVQGMVWNFPLVSSFLEIFHNEWSLLPKIFFMSYDKKRQLLLKRWLKILASKRDNLRKPNSWRLGWTMHVDVPNYYYQFLKPIICRLKFFMWEFSFLKATTHQIKILSYKSTPYIQIPIYWAPKNYTEGLEFRQIYKKNIKCTKDKCTLRSSLESDRFMIFVLLCPVATQLAQSILRRLVVEYEDCLLLSVYIHSPQPQHFKFKPTKSYFPDFPSLFGLLRSQETIS